MKRARCGLMLAAFGVILCACAAVHDPGAHAAGANDDDDDDASAADDDDLLWSELWRPALYGFRLDYYPDDPYNPNDSPTYVLSIYRFVRGMYWDLPVYDVNTVLAQDIWGASANDVFVAGHDLRHDRAAVYRYDGAQWRQQDIVEYYHGLHATSVRSVSGSSAMDVYAAGRLDSALGVAKGETILHYDGQKRTVSFATLGSSENDSTLYDVWCAPSGEAFAVGRWDDYNTSMGGYLVIQNDVGEWEQMKGFDEAGRGCGLVAVWGATAEDIFAVGVCEGATAPRLRALVAHYDGDQWLEMDTPGWGSLDVRDVSGASGEEVYLAANTDQGNAPRIYFFNGSEWSAHEQLNEAIKDHGPIRSIWATSSSELYIVNDQVDVYDQKTGTNKTIPSPPMDRVWAPPSGEGD